MGGDPIDALSDLEKEVLRHFLGASDQKELARRIGRSPATVEQRLARARRKLGVARSLDAALLLADHEGRGTYGTAVYGASLHGAMSPDALKPQPPKAGEGSQNLTFFPTRGRPWNTLPPWARLSLILGGMLVLLITAVAAVSLAEGVTRIVRQFH